MSTEQRGRRTTHLPERPCPGPARPLVGRLDQLCRRPCLAAVRRHVHARNVPATAAPRVPPHCTPARHRTTATKTPCKRALRLRIARAGSGRSRRLTFDVTRALWQHGARRRLGDGRGDWRLLDGRRTAQGAVTERHGLRCTTAYAATRSSHVPAAVWPAGALGALSWLAHGVRDVGPAPAPLDRVPVHVGVERLVVALLPVPLALGLARHHLGCAHKGGQRRDVEQRGSAAATTTPHCRRLSLWQGAALPALTEPLDAARAHHARHQHAHGEAVVGRQRLPVHLVRQQHVLHHSQRRGMGRQHASTHERPQ